MPRIKQNDLFDIDSSVDNVKETTERIVNEKIREDKIREAFKICAENDYVVIKKDIYDDLIITANKYKELTKLGSENTTGSGRYREPSLFVVYENRFGNYIASVCPGAKLSEVESQLLREGYVILKVCDCPSDERFIYCAKEEK